jgi:hypothetical protein
MQSLHAAAAADVAFDDANLGYLLLAQPKCLLASTCPSSRRPHRSESVEAGPQHRDPALGRIRDEIERRLRILLDHLGVPGHEPDETSVSPAVMARSTASIGR